MNPLPMIHRLLQRGVRATASLSARAWLLPLVAALAVFGAAFGAAPAMAQRLAPASGSSAGSFAGDGAPAVGRNILLIVADDIGVDKV
ncbi:MAG: hypothetical protein ACYS26_10930, partial [Planctomycetota bacterium]